ncbi:MAG: glycosyltransferase family 4 protein, partial [candidate division Zixibacteria bacterium]|nr:glycosyltransferase family 4 protein [candidate division Zixibacteria bacterium]
KKGISTDKIQLIMNGVNEDWLANGKDKPLSAAGGTFQVLYFGNHGAAQNLGVVLDAANLLKEEGIAFDFLGDGIEKPALMDKARRMGLSNVTFHSSVAREKLSEKLMQTDIVVVPLVGKPEMDAAVPSKLIEAMAAGKPIVLSARGEAADLVRKSGAGWVVEPDNPSELARVIKITRKEPDEAVEKGKKGKAFVEQNCLRSVLAERLEGMLRDVVEGRRKEI